jgi:hypothetical protein
MTFWKRMVRDGKKTSACHKFRDREGGMNKWSAEDFFRAMKLFCMILQWRLHDIRQLSKVIKLYNTKSES